jgi:NAD(P)-dependent dehydrogenase (short-subunit alcohol dehydrogenase family)
MTQKKFLNNVVLIFGGTSGIGKATAQAFAAQGADVVVVGRRKQLGLEVVELIKKASPESSFVVGIRWLLMAATRRSKAAPYRI